MKFVKYPSIENLTRIETINAVIDQGFSGGEWCATNKIHGANFSFWHDSIELRAAKRSGILAVGGGGLYCSHVVYAKYSENIREMYQYFKTQFTFDSMVVYGELFGGLYTHPEVEKVKQATKIQKGVSYCPHNDFYMFDIAFYVDNTLLFYLSKKAVYFNGKKFGIPAAKIMHLGTFDEMISLNPIFEDPMYKFYNLPKIENNWSEGWVISPVDTKFFNGGSRVILKNKNPSFAERVAKKERKLPEELGVEVVDLLNQGFTYITENRLKNVLSHGHNIGQKDFGKLLSLLAVDAFEAFSKDCGEELAVLSNKNKKLVNKALNGEMARLIRPHFQNILDGNF